MRSAEARGLMTALLCLTLAFASCSSATLFQRVKSDADVAIELSGLYRSNGDRDGELNTLKAFVDQYSLTADSRVAYNLAVCLFERGDYQAAAEICQAGYGAYRAHVRFLRLECACWMAAGEHERALEAYESMLASGDSLTKEDILGVYELMDEKGDDDGKRRVVDTAMQNGIFEREVLELAVSLYGEDEEFMTLLMYAGTGSADEQAHE